MSAQSEAALASGNRIRLARSVVKREIRDGTLSVPEALGLECCRSMLLFDLLQAQHYWGTQPDSKGVKAMELMGQVGVGMYRTCGGLTVRQRTALVDALTTGEAR